MDQNAAALVQDNVSAIECRFNGGNTSYTYLVGWPVKDTDTHAIVRTSEGLQVVAIHDRVDVPVGYRHKLVFAVATFGIDDNLVAFNAHKDTVDSIAKAVRANARAAFKAQMFASGILPQ